MRLTRARSTDRRALRLPTVKPKRTWAGAGRATAFKENHRRAKRSAKGPRADNTAANSAGLRSRRPGGNPNARSWTGGTAVTAVTAALDGQTMTTLGAARGKNLAAAAGAAANQEAVRTSALDLRGLISTFGGHDDSSGMKPLDSRCKRRERRVERRTEFFRTPASRTCWTPPGVFRGERPQVPDFSKLSRCNEKPAIRRDPDIRCQTRLAPRAAGRSPNERRQVPTHRLSTDFSHPRQPSAPAPDPAQAHAKSSQSKR